MSGQHKTESGGDPRGLSIFTDLHPATRTELDTMRRLVRYRVGQVVIHEGEESDFVGIVASGILRMQKNLLDGRHPVVGLLVDGDIFGRVFDGASELAIEAATDAEVIAFPRDPFEALLRRSPDLDQVVLLNLLNELDRAREWMVILSNKKVVNRVAGFLLVMCTRFVDVDHLVQNRQSGMEVKIPVSRLDLAHLLGTRPESISRALHELADAGEIEIIAPDRILISDVGALSTKAGEEDILAPATLKGLLAGRTLDRKRAD